MQKKNPSQSGFFNRRTVIVSAFFFAASLLTYFSFAATADNWQAKVHPDVLTAVAAGDSEFLIYVTPVADLSGAASLSTKEAKGQYVYQKLTAAAEAAQPPVRQTLSQLGAQFQAFWVSNVIWAKGNQAVVQAVAVLPQVAYIAPSPVGGLKLPPQLPAPAPTSPDAVEVVEGSLTSVNADDVWAMGYRGQGAVVAGCDTGVRWTHNALKNHYRGWNGTSADHNYNWKDGIHNPNTGCPGDSPEPCDDDAALGGGHGSHTMGTMVGDDGGANQIGMAPEAKWMACRNMNNGVGVPVTGYLECMQFMLAPTKLDGTAPDPSKAPHVINNSWGCVEPGCVPEPNPPTPGFLRATLQASRAAGIVYVVSAGNEGNNGVGDCSTLEFPLARYPEAFSVGAIDHRTNAAADFSSRGPVLGDPDYPDGLPKPNISAPGVTIRSAQRASDSSYASLSGTSMSGPHVAGLVALIISANPSLAGNVDRIEEIIEQSAVHQTTTQACGSDTSTSIPNNVFGWGRIDALAAVNMALADIGCPVPPFVDDLEPVALPGWTFEVAQNDTTASPTWALMTDPTAHSLTHSFSTNASDPEGVKDDRLIAPPQNLSATSHLRFWHQFNLEETFDGGVLEVSIDGGNTWVDVVAGGGSFVSGGYNGSIDPDPSNESPITGRQAWTGISASAPSMNVVDVNLGAFAGNGVLVRWRLGLDIVSAPPGTGWTVDDIRFTNLACPLPAPIPTFVGSRKTHTGVQDFDIPLPLTGNPGIECRTGGVTQVVVIFGQPVNFTGVSVTSGTGTVSSTTGNGTNQATINLSGVTNAQTITVTLFGASFAIGGASADIPIPIGVLLGDVNASRRTDAGDVTQVRNKTVSIPDATTFRMDVNASGRIDAGDVTTTRNATVTVLP
jgi:serine protease AprX